MARRRAKAFSMLELLVVVAIMMIVAGMMLTTMHAVWKLVRSWQASGEVAPALVARVG